MNETIVNENNILEKKDTFVTKLNDDLYIIVWVNGSSGIVGQMYSSITDLKVRDNYVFDEKGEKPVVKVIGENKYVIVYLKKEGSDYTVYFKLFDIDNYNINILNTVNVGDCNDGWCTIPDLSVIDEERFMIAFEHSFSIIMKFFNIDTCLQDGDDVISNFANDHPIIVNTENSSEDNTGYLLFARDHHQIKLQHFNNQGSDLVSTNNGNSPSRLAYVDDGYFVLAWTNYDSRKDSRNLYYKSFDETGSNVGLAIKTTSDNVASPFIDVGTIEGNNIILIWIEKDEVNKDTLLYGRIVHSFGLYHSLKSFLIVNSRELDKDIIQYPKVQVIHDSKFIVTWTNSKGLVYSKKIIVDVDFEYRGAFKDLASYYIDSMLALIISGSVIFILIITLLVVAIYVFSSRGNRRFIKNKIARFSFKG